MHIIYIDHRLIRSAWRVFGILLLVLFCISEILIKLVEKNLNVLNSVNWPTDYEIYTLPNRKKQHYIGICSHKFMAMINMKNKCIYSIILCGCFSYFFCIQF